MALSTNETSGSRQPIQAGRVVALHVLRRRLDRQLAGLAARDAGCRLRAVFEAPAALRQQVKARASY